MTIRPSGKARKRTPPVPVQRRQTPEQMEAELRAAEERLDRARGTWIDGLEAGAQRIIDEADKMPAADVADAWVIVRSSGLLREHEEAGRVRDALFEAFQIGKAAERIKHRPLAEIARLETENYTNWQGIGIRLEPQEARICRFMDGRTEASLVELYRACWGEPYNPERHGSKVRTALSALSAKFTNNAPPIRARLSVDGDRVILIEGT